MRSFEKPKKRYAEPREEMYLLGLAFLKYLCAGSVATVAGFPDGPLRLVVPEEARWDVVRSDPTGTVLLRALTVFVDQAEDADLDRIFNTTGLLDLAANPELLRRLFASLEQEEAASADGLPDLVDRLVERSLRQAGWRGEEHYTSSDVALLLATLLNPASAHTIYDPTCGTGNLLGTCYSHALRGGDANAKPKLFGQEINADTASLARIKATVRAISQVRIATGDTLRDPAFVEGSGVQKFDRVVADPPLAMHMDPAMLGALQDDRFGRFNLDKRQRTRDWAFLQHVVSSLGAEGRAVMLFDPRRLIAGEDREIRKSLVESDLVEAVVGLPGGVLAYTGTPAAVLVLNMSKPPESRGRTMFVFAQEAYEQDRSTRSIGEGQRKKIVDAVLERREHPRFAAFATVDEMRQQDYELFPSRYVDIVGRDTFIGGLVQWRTLGDLARVIRGSRLHGTHSAEGHAPVIQGRDLSLPRVVPDNLAKITGGGSADHVYSERDDILVQRIGPRPRPYLVDEDLAGVLIRDSVYVVRLLDCDGLLARYLVDFLNSDTGQTLLSLIIRGAGAPTLGLADLRTLQVPVPDDTIVELCSGLHEVERELFERVDEARSIRRRLFGIEDPEQARSQLRSLHAEGRLLAEGLVRVEELDFQVGTFYPFPLAYPYRTSRVILEPSMRYDEQLRMIENIFAYLATAEVLLAAHVGALSEADERTVSREVLQKHWRGGASLGDWEALGRRAARAIRQAPTDPVVEEFAHLWFKKRRGREASDLAKKMAPLVEQRNSHMHGRGPKTPYEFQKGAEDLQATIEYMLKALAIFAEHPLRLVQDLNSDWKTSEVVSNTLLYTGDHPGMRQESLTLPKPLPKDSLHLVLADDDWASLYPLMNVMYCPRCGARETYFVDRWDGPGETPVLKSFERGHVFEEPEIADKIGEHIAHWLDVHLGPPAASDSGNAAEDTDSGA